MMKRCFIQSFLLIVAAAAGGLMAAQPPNVVLVLTDDQGYGDMAAHGNPVIHTPEMDRLHHQSVRLTEFHVDPTCAPTRGALMTGKYSHRARVWHTVQGGNHLRASEVTMGDVFKYNGYQTAIFGKWHLGANYPYRPMDRGFDEWLGLGDGGPGSTDDFFWNDRVNDTYWHNGEREFRPGYNPDVLFDAAINYVKKRDTKKPFFLYLPTYVPHGPWTIPDPQMAQRFLDFGLTPRLAYFYAMIERADQNLGRLRQVLDDENLTENTIFIFATDNGSNSGWVYFNAGMRKGKGSYYDGGHRVPCFIHWPAGKLGVPRDIENLTAHIDLLPTLADLCGLSLPKPIDFDGTSLVPLLRSENPDWPERTLFVERQRTVDVKKGVGSAVLTDQWRLINLKELYDIIQDPGQENDLASMHPEVVQQLQKKFDRYWDRVTPDDRSYLAPIAGTTQDEEIYLAPSELRESSKLWHHGATARGDRAMGVWHLIIAEAGTYEFEVRRWPKEVQVPMVGVPVSTKAPDSWFDNIPKLNLLDGEVFTALPIAAVSLKTGVFTGRRNVSKTDPSVVFEADMLAGRTTVDATFYDQAGEELTQAYYVYIRKK